MNTIKINNEHLLLIQEALDLYMRCSIGQFERILDVPSVHEEIWSKDDKAIDLEYLLKQAHKLYTGSENGGPGIYNKEKVKDDAREVHFIHDQIRYHLWKKSGEKPKGFVYENDAIVKLIEIE